MNRRPPAEVRQQLRKEIGFTCPVENCHSPFLEWHHFDPPWSVKKHHNPEGMIALCTEHHKQADAKAFTTEQLQNFKLTHQNSTVDVQERFNWMRHKMIFKVGNFFYYETPIMLAYRNRNYPLVWFNRDPSGYLLLSVSMPTKAPEERIRIRDNFWIVKGNPVDLECPPSGKRLKVRYANDDSFGIEFKVLDSLETAAKIYPSSYPEDWGVNFPLTAVEIYFHVSRSNLSFQNNQTIVGNTEIGGSVIFRDNPVGLVIG